MYECLFVGGPQDGLVLEQAVYRPKRAWLINPTLTTKYEPERMHVYAATRVDNQRVTYRYQGIYDTMGDRAT